VRVAVTFAFTELVVTLNVAEVWPAGTVTLAGTVALPLPLARLMTVLLSVAELSVTVPVAELPATTLVGETLKPASATTGLTVRLPVFVTTPYVAVRAAVTLLFTAVVKTLNVAAVCPARTVTEVGTVALPLPLAKLMLIFASGAEVSVTVPETELPPTTLAGEMSNEASATTGLIVRVAALVTLL